MAWTDPPAAPSASVALINDLDLRVTHPDGKATVGKGRWRDERSLSEVEVWLQ